MLNMRQMRAAYPETQEMAVERFRGICSAATLALNLYVCVYVGFRTWSMYDCMLLPRLAWRPSRNSGSEVRLVSSNASKASTTKGPQNRLGLQVMQVKQVRLRHRIAE
jgi:hypothetical protein